MGREVPPLKAPLARANRANRLLFATVCARHSPTHLPSLLKRSTYSNAERNVLYTHMSNPRNKSVAEQISRQRSKALSFFACSSNCAGKRGTTSFFQSSWLPVPCAFSSVVV